MQKRWVNSLLVMASVTLVACDNGVNFTGKPSGQTKAADPIVPPVIVTPPIENPDPIPALSFKAGTCAVNQSEKVLSCLDCQSTPGELPPLLLSRKAQELLDIMTAGCAIPNESDPKGYVAPSRDAILKRLIQCSPTLYPDTTFTGSQKKTIEALLTNKNAQHSAFANFYYNWASTDFETYFGLEIGEARYSFCRGAATFNSGGVYPKEYWDAWYAGTTYTLPPVWVKAQKIRQNLRNCMAESLANPNPPQAPGTPGKTCRYETAEGDMGPQIVEKAHEWIKAGHKVYFEGFEMCGQIEFPENLMDRTGPVKIAIKVCDP